MRSCLNDVRVLRIRFAELADRVVESFFPLRDHPRECVGLPHAKIILLRLRTLQVLGGLESFATASAKSLRASWFRSCSARSRPRV